MHLLISMLLSALGACEAVYWQKLRCPYDLKHESLQRVWCKQSSTDCCTGLTFSQNAHLVDGGKVKVTQGSDFFTVAVLELRHGEGVYWCGVLSINDTLIKLADGYFHSSSVTYIWSFTRWFLLPLLPMVTIFTSVYCRTTTKHSCKKPEEPDDDTATSRALTDPYENAVSVCELE
ncbi:CMRF35-like molecule 8 [Lates japonicus]